jgi:hypothetical protein
MDHRSNRRSRVRLHGVSLTTPEPPLTFGPMRRYHLSTFGCQMNAHDSERIKGLLEELGLG